MLSFIKYIHKQLVHLAGKLSTLNMQQVSNTTSPSRPSSQFLLTLITLKCVLFLLGVTGNVAVIIYHSSVNRDRTPSSYFVANLACADLMFCLSVYPLWISRIILILTGVECSSKFVCQFSHVSGSVSVALSALSLLVITYDRYIFISQPLHYFYIMTWKRTCTILAAVWIFALTVIPILVSTEVWEKGNVICEETSRGEVWVIIAFVDLPVAFIVYFNLKIFKIAREQTRRIAEFEGHQNNKLQGKTSHRVNVKEMKAVKTFAAVTGVLLCCYIPFSAMIIVKHFVCSSCIPTIAHFLILELIGINSVVNACIYGLRHRQYRKGYGRILSMLFTCAFNR